MEVNKRLLTQGKGEEEQSAIFLYLLSKKKKFILFIL